VDLRIDVAAAPHHAIEPRAAVAAFAGDGALTLWAGTQDPFFIADVLARRLGLPPERVRVQPCRIGGGFGGRTTATVELEAALLARAVGAPVKVQWTRAMELQQAFHRPPSSHRLRARLSVGGSLADWWHGQASGHVLFTSAVLPPWLQALASLTGDGGVARGMTLPYRAARRFAGFDLERLPVPSGPWRGLGAGPNGLAMESAIDACARRAGADPLAWRRREAAEPRLARVLDAVAEAAGWATPPAREREGHRLGRGVACGIYKERAFAAVVAEVAVADDGAVRVTRLVCAHDAGFVVNPDAVRAQCEGNLVWGLAMVLHDRLPYADGRVTAGNFAEAPLPRHAEVPPLQAVLVDEGDAPGGAGETAIVAAAAAIANAITDATGTRPTRFPIDPAAFARR
jgi:isoquinoline 1-oxidoreductase beta subunit